MHTTDMSMAMILVLGAVHGINPAMGWLFSVSLGLQEQRRAAVWTSLAPLALGHALAIAATIAGAAALGVLVPVRALRLVAAALLLSFGFFHLMRHRHPRLAGMRVGAKDLTLWSFLMASAHGAGLMVLPFLLGTGGEAVDGATQVAGVMGEGLNHGHALGSGPALAGIAADASVGLTATLVHTAGYLLMSGLIAALVYEKLGLRLLRVAWINLNAIWAGALVLTAVITVVWPF